MTNRFIPPSLFLMALLLALSDQSAFAGFRFDYEVETPAGKRTRYAVPSRAKEFGLTLPTKAFKCMIRSEVLEAPGKDRGVAELWCCPELPSASQCVVSSILCTEEVDGTGNLTLVELIENKKDKENDKDKKEKEKEKDREKIEEVAKMESKKTAIGFYCLYEEIPDASPKKGAGRHSDLPAATPIPAAQYDQTSPVAPERESAGD